MEHPLIGDLSHLTIDELGTKISDLSRKLDMAARTGNGHLCDQIRMAIESYRSKYQQRQQEEQAKTNANFDDKINIQ